MPTDLGQPFQQSWRGSYPHMLKEDVPVWDLFLDRNPNFFKQIYYDVRVGGVMPGPGLGDEKMRKMFYDNTAKRIDALGELEDELWIIEVAAKPVLVCQYIDADLQKAIEFHGVLLRLVI